MDMLWSLVSFKSGFHITSGEYMMETHFVILDWSNCSYLIVHNRKEKRDKRKMKIKLWFKQYLRPPEIVHIWTKLMEDNQILILIYALWTIKPSIYDKQCIILITQGNNLLY
jgi:hypothetical protein